MCLFINQYVLTFSDICDPLWSPVFWCFWEHLQSFASFGSHQLAHLTSGTGAHIKPGRWSQWCPMVCPLEKLGEMGGEHLQNLMSEANVRPPKNVIYRENMLKMTFMGWCVSSDVSNRNEHGMLKFIHRITIIVHGKCLRKLMIHHMRHTEKHAKVHIINDHV